MVLQNQGTATASMGGVVVQGYYSPDGTTYDPSSQDPACGWTSPGFSLPAGGSALITVGCSAAPGPADTYLGVMVDTTNVVAESKESNNVTFVALP